MLLYLLFKLIVIDFSKVILKYIKIYYSSFFLYIYILKRNYTVKKNLLYTQKHTYLREGLKRESGKTRKPKMGT